MSATTNANKSAITLKGSSEIVCEYLDFGVNSILYQRGIYPPEDFKTVENYGLLVYMSQDKRIREFLNSTLGQLKEWLTQKLVNKVALVITNVRTKEVLERWDFNVSYEGDPTAPSGETSKKPLKEIQKEIRDVLKQVASSIAFLPSLDSKCSFDLQLYTKNDIDLPKEWTDAPLANIKNADCVRLRSFSTKLHKLQTVVTYKQDN